MKLSVLGFNHAKAYEAGLSIVDLMLFEYFIEARNLSFFHHKMKDDILYTAITPEDIKSDLPILWLTDEEIKNRLAAYEEYGFILSDNGYYCITDKIRNLRNSN